MEDDTPFDISQAVPEARNNALLMRSSLGGEGLLPGSQGKIQARRLAWQYLSGGWRVLGEFDLPMLAAILYSLQDGGFTFRKSFFRQFHLEQGGFIDPAEFNPEMLVEFVEMSGPVQRIFSDAHGIFGEHAGLAQAAGVDNEDWEKLVKAVFVAAVLHYQEQREVLDGD